MSSPAVFFEAFRATRLGILIDDAGEAPHAALVIPAEGITEPEMNRALSLTGGLPFVALSPERAMSFMLPSMARPQVRTARAGNAHQSPLQFVSVEAREGISTGISAFDRATTVAILGADAPQPRKLVKPGHIFPVETRQGGVLVKTAVPEGALDIVKAAGFTDAALFMDLLDRVGELLSPDAAIAFAKAEGVPCLMLTSLIEYRLEHETLVSRVAEAQLPTLEAGEVRSIIYRSRIHEVEHIAFVKGNVSHGGPVLVRVQAENTVADVFGGPTPPARKQIQASLRAIGARGEGVLLYLRRSFMDAAGGQPQILPSAPLPAPRSAVMMREYGVGAQILRDLGIVQIDLLSTTSRSMVGLSSFGIDVVSQHSIPELV
jgi:3,4-dihydroxy 2-butanone 4-phosphate synthase/GTP cyclohydrolase II